MIAPVGSIPAGVELARKVKRLSAAVWILAILLCITLLVSFLLVRSLSVVRSEFDGLSPEQRVRAAFEMSDSLRELTLAGLRTRHPD